MSVADQVVTVLNPLRNSDDGTQSVTMALQPEGLGTVQATVTVAGQQVSVNLWTDSATGHAALSQTLSQLHSQLSDGSDHHVAIDLADFGSAQPDARGVNLPRVTVPPQSGNTAPQSQAEPFFSQGATDAEFPVTPGAHRVDLEL